MLVASSTLISATDAMAQSQKVSIGQSPTIVSKGNYSSGLSTTAVKTFSSGALPIYTTLDTVNGTATDSFKYQLVGGYNSVTFQHDFLKVAGTPTVQVSCYVSANGGVSYDWSTPIAAYTVNPSSLTAQTSKVSVINSGNGNPYTNYIWVTTGSASSTISAKGYVVPR